MTNNDEKVLRPLLTKAHDELRELKASVAEDLHDDIMQKLTAISLELSSLRFALADGPANKPAISKVDELITMAQTVSIAIRQLCNKLHPAVLDQFGLVSAIEDHCSHLEESRGVHTDVRFASDVPLDPRLTAELWSIFLVLSSDACEKQASLFELRGEQVSQVIFVIIGHDGHNKVSGGQPNEDDLLRLEISERIERLGGTITWKSAEDWTECFLTIPLIST